MNKIEKGDPDSQSADIKANNISQLAELFPEAMVEGKVDFEVLKQLLDGEVDENDEKYGLNWHGKRAARELAMTPSTGTLRPCPEDSVDWDTTQNLLIEGDNLEVLKILQKSYAGKVKMIYIDPPYNTGKDFVYKDNYRDGIKNYKEITGQTKDGAALTSNPESSGRYHTDWMNMIYSRLELSKNLMQEGGVIFISIDDNEYAHLKLICDLIFGEENFIETYIWESTFRPDNSSDLYRENAQYVMAFSKNIQEVGRLIGNTSRSEGLPSLTKNSMNLKTLEFPSGKVNFKLEDGHYSAGPRDSGYTLEDDVTVIDGFNKDSFRLTGRVIWGQSNLEREIAEGTEIIIKSDGMVPYTKKIKTKTLAPNTLIPRERVGDVLAGRSEVAKLLGPSVFDYPKPTSLIEYLISNIDNSNQQDSIILDFFLGSGTTSHSVLNYNSRADSQFSYIGVQLPESVGEEAKPTLEFLDQINKPNNISEITKERLRRAGAKIKEENPLFTGDTGFRVFKLDSSNINAWDPDSEDLEGTLAAHTEHVKSDRTEDDVLYELLLKRGLDLCVPIEKKEVEGKAIRSIGGGVLFACLATELKSTTVDSIAQSILDWRTSLNPAGDTTCVFRDSAFEDDVAKTNMVAILKQGGIDNVRSL